MTTPAGSGWRASADTARGADGRRPDREGKEDLTMTTDNLGFVQLMQNFRRGTLISAADAKLAELLEAIAETARAAR